MAEQNKDGQINIELSEEMAQGVYSNLVAINHSPTEFVLDFIQMMPGVPKAKVKSRVVMNPQNAKRLMLALNDNIKRFEQINGPIKASEPGEGGFPMSFGGPTAEA